MEALSRSRQVVLWLCTSVMVLYPVLLQVQTVKCQSFPYSNDLPYKQMLPFCVELPGYLRSGKIIKIMGIFENTTDSIYKDDEPQNPFDRTYPWALHRQEDSVDHFHQWHRSSIRRQPQIYSGSFRTSPRAKTRFMKPYAWMNVILRSQCLSPDSPFQFTVRFDNQTVTRNSFKNGNWGEKIIKGPFPFSLETQFMLLIEVRPDGYMVKGNGVPLWTFEHRFSFDDVKYLQVRGEQVIVRKIELIDPEIKGQQHSQLVYPVPLTKPVIHSISPFLGQFPEEVQTGKAIRIKGYFPTKPDKVSINLCADCFKGPIMLRLDVRFGFTRLYHYVDRDSYINGKWQEERFRNNVRGPFPFSVGEPFDLVIQITPQSFNISVNNEECWTYNHKLPYTEISYVWITKGMNVWKIEYIDFPEKEHSSPLMLTEESDLNKSSSAASVYDNIVYTVHTLPFFLLLKAM